MTILNGHYRAARHVVAVALLILIPVAYVALSVFTTR